MQGDEVAVPADGATGLLQGRYRLDGVLGTGGMATVYRAHDELLGRTVAVKLFRSPGADDEEVRRQESEARVLAPLTMHGLVTLLDAGVEVADDGLPRVFLVMELVEGKDLKEMLRGSPFTLKQVAHFGFDLSEALDYVHQHGVVHRDVKPANVLLLDYGSDRRPRVKLADFGIATIVGRGSMLQEEYTTGTAAYLSPEQAAGESVGTETDVYSLGLVLLECITGRTAFPGSVVESALARLQRGPHIPADLPDDWRAVLKAMTARNPADRPSLDELVRTFRQLVIDESGRHRVEPDPTRPITLPQDTEVDRLAALARYETLDAPPDGTWDRLTAMAARVFGVPMAAITLIEQDRVRVVARFGLEVAELPRRSGPRDAAALSLGVVVVPDCRADPGMATHPFVQGPPHARFYAGAPLLTEDGHYLGTFSLLDIEPRDLSAEERETLADLAAVVMHEMDVRLAARRAVLSIR